MTEPTRLLDGTPGLGRELLRSAEQDGPSEQSVAKAMAAAAAIAAVTSSTSQAAAGSGVAIASVLKWLGVGALIGSVTAYSADRIMGPPDAPREVRQPASLRPGGAVPIAPRGTGSAAQPVVAAPSSPSAPASLPPRTGASGASASLARDLQPHPDSLAAELRLLDAARSALARGDTASALQALAEYDSSYPAGRFRQESSRLRIEARVKQGDCAQARRDAAEFKRLHPDSILTKRTTSLLKPCR